MVGKEVGERALRLDRRASSARSSTRRCCELIDAGFLYEAEIYPERVLAFRHPLTREVAYGTQLAEQRAATHAATARATDRAQPRPPRRAGGADRPAHGGRAARRWRRRAGTPAPPTGPATASPSDALRLWRRVMELADELDETEETAALGVSSRLLQLDYAWRLGMDSEEAARLVARGRARSRPGPATCARWRCCGWPTVGAPRAAPRARTTGSPAAEEANALADESGDLHLRVGDPGRRRLRATSAPATSTASSGRSTRCSSWPATTAASAPGS